MSDHSSTKENSGVLSFLRSLESYASTRDTAEPISPMDNVRWNKFYNAEQGLVAIAASQDCDDWREFVVGRRILDLGCGSLDPETRSYERGWLPYISLLAGYAGADVTGVDLYPLGFSGELPYRHVQLDIRLLLQALSDNKYFAMIEDEGLCPEYDIVIFKEVVGSPEWSTPERFGLESVNGVLPTRAVAELLGTLVAEGGILYSTQGGRSIWKREGSELKRVSAGS